MGIPRRQLQPSTHRWPTGHPPVWIVLIAANTGFYLTQKVIDASLPGLPEDWLGLNPAGISHGYFWQFFTYSFLHANLLHLVANMVLLYFAGREVEALLGVRHFLTIYFGGGVLGGIVQWLSGSLPDGGVIGASACVLAVLIAFTTILPELEITCLLFFVLPVRLRARSLAIGITGASVFFILVPYLTRWSVHFEMLHRALSVLGQNPMTAHYAHLGGCLFGWLYVKQLGYGNPWWIQKYLFDKRQQDERRRRMTSTQFMTEEIDPILEKISRDGVRSLTRRERRLLEMGRDKIEQKPSGPEQ